MADEPETPPPAPEQQIDPAEETPQERDVRERQEERVAVEEQTATARGRPARSLEELQEADRRTAGQLEGTWSTNPTPVLTNPL
jgi:hypothetical protein